MKLCQSTLLYWYYVWQRNGKTPAAFALKFVAGRRYIEGNLLIRFIDFAASRYWVSFTAAWEAFCKCESALANGRQVGRHALYWNLPKLAGASSFEAIKRQWKIATDAQKRIAALRERFISEIRGRVPERLPSQAHWKGVAV